MSDGSRNAPQTAKSSASFHYLAGLGSGLFSAVLLQPADLLKTRVQQSSTNTLRSTFSAIVYSPDATALRVLWRGTLPSALRTGFGSAIYFGGLNALRENVARWREGAGAGRGIGGGNKAVASSASISAAKSASTSSTLPRINKLDNLTTGAIARVSAGLILMPMTVIKVRYESDLYNYRSVLGAARDIVRGEGVRGLFAGFGATALRDAPYAGLYLLFYEECKRVLGSVLVVGEQNGKQAHPEGQNNKTDAETRSTPTAKSMSGSMSATINFTSGMLGAGIATALTNPFDAVKTRIQLRPREYLNAVQAARRMIREDGFKSLFDGLALRIGRKAISSALTWTLYEELIRRADLAWTGNLKLRSAKETVV